jgi:hypothetical protein
MTEFSREFILNFSRLYKELPQRIPWSFLSLTYA